MDDERLAQIRARWERAQPERWSSLRLGPGVIVREAERGLVPQIGAGRSTGGDYNDPMVQARVAALHALPADVPYLLQALADAETRAAQLTRAMAEMGALAHDLAGMEHGARCEQMRAMHHLGIIVTEESLAAHLARADAFTARQYERIDAARPDAGQGEG